jgi:hypothetical protein
MDKELPICATCGVQYPAPREDCPVCLDERQYVGWDGQRWTSLAELAAAGHRGSIREEEPGVLGIGAEPPTAIGQRALLVTTPSGNLQDDGCSATKCPRPCTDTITPSSRSSVSARSAVPCATP